jgi:exopolyphosphatase/guanosine-5'-triphosphate,3'-diphosphate pyrophosphatase
MSATDPKPSQCDAAVVDVGSNSVRLVLYRLDGRAIWSVFNEKVLAGLGRDLIRTGRLAPDGTASAILALRRFAALIESSRPRMVFAAATAAVREARDGGAFRDRVERETGLALRILSGEDEARYAAFGVIAGTPTAQGLVGDLGGASLELTPLGPEGPGRGTTLPLGPFSMETPTGRFDAAAARLVVNRRIAPIERAFASDTLYAVGGAWRNLALLHMRRIRYPLEIVHQYEISRRDILESTRVISQQSSGSLDRVDGISRRRLESLPHAAVVLESLVERLDIQRVIISAHGLREGLLWEALPQEVRGRDPLVAGCAALGSRPAVSEALGQALEEWISPGFAKLDRLFDGRDRLLLAAACRLVELGANLHPDHRADLVFRLVLRAPVAGVDHAERAFLACAAFGRHSAAAQTPDSTLVERLLSPERRQRARALGAGLRLGCELSGRSPELLARTRLDVKSDVVLLQAEPDWAPVLLGEQTARRAQALAELLGRQPRLRAASFKTPSLAPVH